MSELDFSDVPIAEGNHDDKCGHLFSFGAYGDTHVVVLGHSFDNASEVAIEWLDDNAPGLLTTVGPDAYAEAAKELGIAWQPEEMADADTERVVQMAEADMTMVGWTTLKHGNAVPSWEWTGRELSDDELATIQARLVHWICGGGQPGCLYDYGPEACATKADAIENLTFIYGDELSEEQVTEMRADLERDGIHYFPAAVRHDVGASYCDVSEQFGEMPKED